MGERLQHIAAHRHFAAVFKTPVGVRLGHRRVVRAGDGDRQRGLIGILVAVSRGIGELVLKRVAVIEGLDRIARVIERIDVAAVGIEMQDAVYPWDIHSARRNTDHAQRIAIDIGITPGAVGDDVARGLYQQAAFAFTGPPVFTHGIDVVTRHWRRVVINNPPCRGVVGRVDRGIGRAGQDDEEVLGTGKGVRPFIQVIGNDIHHNREFGRSGRDGHRAGQHALIVGARDGRIGPSPGADFIGYRHILVERRTQAQDEGHCVEGALTIRSFRDVRIVTNDGRQTRIARVFAVGGLIDDFDCYVQTNRYCWQGLGFRWQDFTRRLLQGKADRPGRETAIHQPLRGQLIDDDKATAFSITAATASPRAGRRGFGHLRRVDAGRDLGLQRRHVLLGTFR